VHDDTGSGRFLMRVPVALVVSAALVVVSVMVIAVPLPLPLVVARMLAGIALFGAIVYGGVAIQRRRRTGR
jgi:hypothetical protein